MPQERCHYEPGEGIRHMFRSSASGVYIVTTIAPDGSPAGCTASSVTSISLDPAVVSFSLQSFSSCWSGVESCNKVAIHALSIDDVGLAQAFSTPGIDRFAQCVWHTCPDTGLPIIDDLNGYLVGEVWKVVPVGNSRLILSEVKDVSLAADPATPLVHSQRGWWQAAAL